MECLRNLPSKTNAFQTAIYERVRTEHSHSHNKPFFATSGQVPTQSTFSMDNFFRSCCIAPKANKSKADIHRLSSSFFSTSLAQ